MGLVQHVYQRGVIFRCCLDQLHRSHEAVAGVADIYSRQTQQLQEEIHWRQLG